MLRYLGHAPVENRNGLIAAAMVTSVCPLGIDQNTDGSNQNIEIEPERPVAHVVTIQSRLNVEVAVTARLDLPQSGEAGSHLYTECPEVLFEAVVMVCGEGPGTHEAHVATENVEELRKLIKTGAAKEATYSRENARIVLEFAELVPFSSRI
jgi:hypothetical protein